MNTQHSHAEQQVNHGISLTLFMLDTPLTEGQHLRVAVSSVVEPEPPFLAGVGAVKKGAAPAPAQGPAMTPCLKKR